MSSPIDFYRAFQSLLRGRGIAGVLTSGMACVEYGLQQNTKDTDWIIASDDIDSLVALLGELARGVTGATGESPIGGCLARRSIQASFASDPEAVLHLRDPEIVREAWHNTTATHRGRAALERPLPSASGRVV
jgi:hypothetical protein